MAIVAQLVRAPACGAGGRRFESGLSPHFLKVETKRNLCGVKISPAGWKKEFLFLRVPITNEFFPVQNFRGDQKVQAVKSINN